MTKMRWRPFDPAKGSRQLRPPEYKAVLVLVEPKEPGLPHCIAVGYRKNGAGDKQSPYFVIPGHGGKVISWCDCLPPDSDLMSLWRDARKAAGQDDDVPGE